MGLLVPQFHNGVFPPSITLLLAILSRKLLWEPPTDAYFKLSFPRVGSTESTVISLCTQEMRSCNARESNYSLHNLQWKIQYVPAAHLADASVQKKIGCLIHLLIKQAEHRIIGTGNGLGWMEPQSSSSSNPWLWAQLPPTR